MLTKFSLLGSVKNRLTENPYFCGGARQIGKSSALRQLDRRFEHFVEINFDENKKVRSFFEGSLSPQEICQQLALYYRTPIVPGETMLFLTKFRAARALCQSFDIFTRSTPIFILLRQDLFWNLRLGFLGDSYLRLLTYTRLKSQSALLRQYLHK